MARTGFIARERTAARPFVPDAIQQQILALDPRFSAAVLGAPGTGKSTVLIELVAARAQAGTLPDNIAARLEGKSSLGRLGLLTHSTAGFVDPGFKGHVTLELANVSNLPIKLWPGMKVGQLCFFQLSSPSETPYGSEKYLSRYQGQRGPTASRSHLNFHITDVGNEPLEH